MGLLIAEQAPTKYSFYQLAGSRARTLQRQDLGRAHFTNYCRTAFLYRPAFFDVWKGQGEAIAARRSIILGDLTIFST